MKGWLKWLGQWLIEVNRWVWVIILMFVAMALTVLFASHLIPFTERFEASMGAFWLGLLNRVILIAFFLPITGWIEKWFGVDKVIVALLLLMHTMFFIAIAAIACI